MMQQQEWTIEIPARRRLFSLNLRELWQYRDLIMLLVRRDLVAVYKQTILGPFWFLLQPLMTTLIFTIVFGHIIGISTGGVPKVLFYLSGVTIWNLFAASLTKNSELFVANAGIFKKVYFPRLAIPASSMIVHFITFLLQFTLFALFCGYFWLKGMPIRLTTATLLLPLLLVQVAALGFSVGILVSSLTIKYRDLTFLTGFAVQLWMYATPIIYPVGLVPENWQWLYTINPMVFVVESFRHAFWDNGPVNFTGMAVSMIETVVLLGIAIKVFTRVERTFVDTV
jgi:lipopolysaccharide transport system permease protein